MLRRALLGLSLLSGCLPDGEPETTSRMTWVVHNTCPSELPWVVTEFDGSQVWPEDGTPMRIPAGATQTAEIECQLGQHLRVLSTYPSGRKYASPGNQTCGRDFEYFLDFGYCY